MLADDTTGHRSPLSPAQLAVADLRSASTNSSVNQVHERIKVGLLGAGYILDSHATALRAIPGVELHAVCDQSRVRAARAAAKFGIAHKFTSISDLILSDCEVVHVLLPPPLHLEAAAVLVECGKSVFLEKPMGLDSGECDKLYERSTQKRVTLAVGHNFLFSRAYEALREGVKSGELGRIDHLAATWHFNLPALQFGPFDSWMLSAPANIVFEVGSHLAAFMVDLIGVPKIVSAIAGNPIVLPGNQTVYRHWTAVCHTVAATALFSISTTGGHADRILRLRGRGGSAQLDFGRDIGWREVVASDNPIFDSYQTAKVAGRELLSQARRDRIRRVKAALTKRPDANPFEETVFRSIATFYARGLSNVDPRHDGKFAADVVRVCEAVAEAAKVGRPSSSCVSVAMPKGAAKPNVLVVGGTGFIGRPLVRALVDRGYGVRILSRNPRAGAIEFVGLPIEIVAGAHGDAECVRRALEGVDVVYHLAKCEGKNWQDYVQGDIEPTRVLAEAALAASVRRFVYTGTIASYASDRSRQVINNATLLDVAIARRGHYARSKAACEAVLQRMHREAGLPLVILRPGIVIGGGTPPWHLGIGRFASETRVDYWGDGRNHLPLVLVDDVALALVRAMEVAGIEGQTFLVTSPPLMTARDYVAALALYMGTRIDARPRSPWRNWASDMVKELAKNAVRHPNRRWPSLHDWRCNSHASRYDARMTEEVLDWHPVSDKETMMARGIADAVDWFTR